MANRQKTRARKVNLVDGSFARETNALDVTSLALYDRRLSDGVNVDHLVHTMMGYRAVIVWGRDADCPFSSGGARASSWELGASMARADLSDPRKVG